MKRLLRAISRMLALALPLSGACQYCVPTTAVPYAASMPGLTLVQVNSLMRTSQDIENYPYNSYVNTEQSVTVTRGESYPITLGFTIDAQISPHMNLRIWVDLNHDGQLDDPGETLYTVDHVSQTQNNTITIPATAMTGPTRMRITAKMCSHGGHSLPTPCDMPADILGYHGEIEDYEMNIVDEVGIGEHDGALSDLMILPNPSSGAFRVEYALKEAGPVSIDVLDLSGRVAASLLTASEQSPGDHVLTVDQEQAVLPQGSYLLRISMKDDVRILKLAIER
jgi:hypothetical protein